jgi:Host cell surface-exposed lipoprotein
MQPGPGGYGPPPTQPKRKSWGRRQKILTGLMAAVVLIVIAVIASGGSGGNGGNTTASSGSAAQAQPAVQQSSSAPASQAPQYTASQQQAIDAAEGYLSDGQGFSRLGLISQLSSPDGNGFSKTLARFAVRHVSVDWDHQAAIAAKGYVSDGEGFSYSGLVQQLESSYGDQFTHAQAVYGAKAAGL